MGGRRGGGGGGRGVREVIFRYGLTLQAPYVEL